MTQSPDPTGNPLFSGVDGKPAIAVVFGGADNFRYNMGVELFEHQAAFLTPVFVHDGIMPMALSELLWYRSHDAPEADAVARLAAVIAVSVGTFQVFVERYGVEVQTFAGSGVGFVSAAIASGAIELAKVLRLLRDEALTESDICDHVSEQLESPHSSRALVRLDSASALVDVLDTTSVDAVVDLGPGNASAVALRSAGSVLVPIGAIDSPTNRLHIQDHLRRGKYYDAAYLVERVLAQLVGTRNLDPEGDGHRTVSTLTKRLKQMLRSGELSRELSSEGVSMVSGEIREALSCWITNGLAKGYENEQILASVVGLEHETLLPLRNMFDVSDDRFDAFDLREVSGAARHR